MKKIRVSLIGAFPPSVGGVSTYISNLSEVLLEDKLLGVVYSTSEPKGYVEKRFRVINVYFPRLRYSFLTSLLWFFLYGLRDKSTIFHLNGHPVWESPTIWLLLLVRKNVVFTIHDQLMLERLEAYPPVLGKIFRYILSNNHIYWIPVNNNIRLQLERINPKIENITVIPAYIPLKEKNIKLNEEIITFVNSRSKLITVYAHSIRREKGKDIYGIDQAIRAIDIIRNRIRDVGLIICIPDEKNEILLNDYRRMIKDLALEQNVLLFLTPVTNPLMLWRISDIVLRPTLTDGDSLIVREALSQGTYVIASNCVPRPDNTVLYKSMDIENLVEKIFECTQKRNVFDQTKKINAVDLHKAIYSVFI